MEIDVTISGHKKEDPLSKMTIDKQVRNELPHLATFLPVQHIMIHIDRYKETGKRVKYSVKARLMTSKGSFFANDHAWDISKAIRGVLDKLEREIRKKSEKMNPRK